MFYSKRDMTGEPGQEIVSAADISGPGARDSRPYASQDGLNG